MTAADAAWLRMDRPTNLMVVTSVMWFEGTVNGDDLRGLLHERVLSRFPRFTQRVVSDQGLFWEDVQDFSLEDHLHPVRLPAPGGRAELQALTSSLVSVPLPAERPLWDLYVVDGFASGTALVFRMHHAIADGIALSRLLLTLTDDPAEDDPPVDAPTRLGAASLLEAGLHEVLDLATHPRRLLGLADPRKALELGRSAAANASALATLALLPADHPTPLRGPVDVVKRVVWSEPISLARIKAGGHAAGFTVNDVLMAGVAGALRTHLVRRRSPVVDVRAIVPFNLRPPLEPLPAELGNRFGLVYLELPLTAARRAERLRLMGERMRAIKDSALGPVSYGLLELVGLAPAGVENLAIDVFASKGTGVMTNVPGPRRPVTLAGRRLQGTIGWGPTSGNLGLGVAIFSYAGEVTIGLCVDVGLVPDAEELLTDIVSEVDAIIDDLVPV